MKTIIAGCRYKDPENKIVFDDLEIVALAVLESNFKISEIVSGRAIGVDSLGEQIAMQLNLPLSLFPANWNKYGKSAGYIRNKEMAKYADAAIIIWDGESDGTKNMIDEMKKLNKPCYVKIFKDINDKN